MTCAEDGCNNPVRARGLCHRDYERRRKAGTLPPIHCPIEGCINDRDCLGPCRSHRDEFTAAGMKWCTGVICNGQLKPVDEFAQAPNGRRSRDGLYDWCRPCRSQYYVLHPGGKARKRNLGWVHGITEGRYQEMWAQQDGRCQICSKLLDRDGAKSDVPCIDHDHMHCPGRLGCPECVRSILCKGCNSMLGRAYDDPAILRRWKPSIKQPRGLIGSATGYLEYWHSVMADRGIRPSRKDALWDDIFAAARRLVLGIAPN